MSFNKTIFPAITSKISNILAWHSVSNVFMSGLSVAIIYTGALHIVECSLHHTQWILIKCDHSTMIKEKSALF